VHIRELKESRLSEAAEAEAEATLGDGEDIREGSFAPGELRRDTSVLIGDYVESDAV
jgi:hypothetical protein